MSWQKCPVCNGTGLDTTTFQLNTCSSPCPTCQGARIISEITGFPPNGANVQSQTFNSDFSSMAPDE